MESTPFNRIKSPAIPIEDIEGARTELRNAVGLLSAYKLNQSAKWYSLFRAGELLLSIASQTPAISVYTDPINQATDAINLARVLFDLHEYFKVASVLTEFAKPDYPQAYFLYHYALFMVTST